MRTESTATSQQAAVELGSAIASAPHRDRRATRCRPVRHSLPAVLSAAGGLLALMLALGPGAPAAAAATYSLVDLGASFNSRWYSRAHDINASGQIVGEAGDGTDRAWLYDSTGMHDLGKLLGYASRAFAISDAGQVVGDFARGRDEEGNIGPSGIFLYDRTGVYYPGGDWIDPAGKAFDINTSGQIVGRARSHAFLYSDGVMRDLGTLGGSYSQATAINNQGQVVGWSYLSDQPQVEHAFLYDNGVMRDLGALGTGTVSWASDINDLGQVVGYSTTRGRSGVTRAFLYDAAGIHDLGGLHPKAVSYAYGINNRGQVVGYADVGGDSDERHAVLWEDGVIKDLNRLIPPVPAGCSKGPTRSMMPDRSWATLARDL